MFEMYATRPRFVLGFHGCDQSVADILINNPIPTFKPSDKKYDWLGTGMYFWENDPQRAHEYVMEAKKREEERYPNPTVIGAVLDLGHCLDLTERRYMEMVRSTFDDLRALEDAKKIVLPENRNVQGDTFDFKLRNLDRLVVETAHAGAEQKGEPFASSRAMFIEGGKLFPGAGFHNKTHVQIAIRDPKCILGYFKPIEEHIHLGTEAVKQ